uniref:Uncharacterized protein isoform X2 n=1 Tax=Pogona vitticeps TaxID=103695 RepID=A0ABM5GF04_9SAUR
MPLTRSKMAESEPKSPEMSEGTGEVIDGEGDRFTSEREEENNGEHLSELRKIQLAQEHEYRMRQLEREAERERMALEKEERMRQMEMEREERERQFELEKQRMALEIRRMELLNQNNNNNRDNEESQLSKADLKKFPSYKQGDSVEAFLTRFEKAASDFSLREAEKMVVLRSLISGKMAEIYADMPVELSKDYSEFKKLVFLRFDINSEHLRQKFRKLTKKSDETFTQLGYNLERCLDRWLEQENVQTFQQLKNIVGLEQFYSLLRGELKYLVQERKPTDIRQAAQIADFISQIRGPVSYEEKGMRKTWDPKYSKEPGQGQAKMGSHFVGKTSGQSQSRNPILEGKEKSEKFTNRGSWGDKICFACQGRGHIASQCFNTTQKKEISPQKVNLKEAKSVYCIQNSQMSPSRDSPVAMGTQPEAAASSSEMDTSSGQSTEYQDLPIAEIRHCLYIQINSQLLESAGDRIKILGQNYTALQDTCSQVSICHSDIVPQGCIIPGQNLILKGIGKEIVSLPVADVLVDYQGWRGVWRMGVSSQIPTPCLIGTDLTKHVKSALVITRSQPEQREASNGTGSQEQEENIPQAEAFSLEIPQKSVFARDQTADPTLKSCFGEVAGKGLSPKHGLLYKEKLINIPKEGPEIKSQLIVPDKYRPMILEKGHLGIAETKQRISQKYYWPKMGKEIKEFSQAYDTCQGERNSEDKANREDRNRDDYNNYMEDIDKTFIQLRQEHTEQQKQEHREVSELRTSEDEVKQVNFVHTKSKENQETSCYPEIVKLKTLEESNLKSAEVVSKEKIQLTEKADNSVSAPIAKTKQQETLSKKPKNKEVALEKVKDASKIKQVNKREMQGVLKKFTLVIEIRKEARGKSMIRIAGYIQQEERNVRCIASPLKIIKVIRKDKKIQGLSRCKETLEKLQTTLKKSQHCIQRGHVQRCHHIQRGRVQRCQRIQRGRVKRHLHVVRGAEFQSVFNIIAVAGFESRAMLSKADEEDHQPAEFLSGKLQPRWIHRASRERKWDKRGWLLQENKPCKGKGQFGLCTDSILLRDLRTEKAYKNKLANWKRDL